MLEGNDAAERHSVAGIRGRSAGMRDDATSGLYIVHGRLGFVPLFADGLAS